MSVKNKCNRCAWVNDDPLYISYHDTEWGVPVFDDRVLFELLILEGMQAGLSWLTVLKKRENFRQSFDNFNAKLIAQYDQSKIESLLNNTGIIRNHLKINATIQNAKAFLEIQKKYGSFSDYVWQFVDGKPILNNWENIVNVPAKTIISDTMSNDLKKQGFKFVGSTICYAFMQAVGMVNDHTLNCFRHGQ
ncbi:DNA-3-methyladenine glycosylase I [Legionella impletisoli]|uniref:DNA-3-methyladenine glycosylase I n=1 Tax=Legionella impletisoli TaxID=343510 RepID=A0A917JY93_9GAMM|nr:DNA-3-methyladenine glycosylase I [Legionella impletisoli]GGI92450.1 DNA-3-methyladenine glycosylase I [Legionella impletisoli]